jgi:hypothetical protein
VHSDVLLFLQETNQKYVFVSPENKSGVVPVHTLIAREKPGADNKAGLLIKNPPKKTRKKHLKKPTKIFFLFFSNFYFCMKIIQTFLFETDFL